MIVWLASYPRSGNTLLREILWQTMGLGSYDEHNLTIPVSASFKQAAGHLDYAGEWGPFYARAAAGRELHLIKTHRPPQDGGRAIYVVRDGRSSCDSYYHYQRSYFPQSPTSHVEVIVGAVTYGEWSEHFAAWDGRADTLVVRFEELVAAGPELLGKIAAFIGYAGHVRAWKNPMAELRKHDPAFFRRGDSTWKVPAGWTGTVNALFWALHGELMERLGYGRAAEEVAAEPLALARELGACLKAGAAHRRMLQEACDERLALVERLHKEGQVLLKIREDLQRTCGEQAEEIRGLERQLAGMREMAHL